mmetsp:Transcript_12972/g.38124  ORF Transcript_12972/g.38124 Transcript_12972/m.38124 type:complete len:91 (-) Transcript_12972:415-687(-)|eukprot:CAMPEP_0206032834 /NCGR_PEP_ID=MMETSP1466-20131121/228_1 /ASSEMBLY_ACC=CAM_ASM_001126 /TAXON_ID=44452 /ORGANISM="Pavlova gyrans, Strain CCMP608" /LENGTH=90 /DNA_ID=CAMNT_0053406987 /DNA_START=1187 /DNA_END=1459 /DNA_ORIENTATION=-
MPRADTRPYRNGFEHLYATMTPQLYNDAQSEASSVKSGEGDSPSLYATTGRRISVDSWNGLDYLAVTSGWTPSDDAAASKHNNCAADKKH